MACACIALGSNLGDRHASLARALEMLGAAPQITVLGASDFIETAPVDCPPGAAAFLNAAAILETTLCPSLLLDRLLQIEQALGRRRESEPKNAPRTLDMDLLLYDERVIDLPGLIVPHPRMHQRAFVLIPLAQVAPEARHPILGKTVSELLTDLRHSMSNFPPDRAAAPAG